MEGQKMNAPFYLLYHINHTANAELWPLLRKRMKSFHPSVFRILKLLWNDLFDSSLYTNRQRIAHGAFAQVYTATFTQGNGDSLHHKSVVLKTVDLPKGPHEPCKFFDIYSEVEILEKFTGDPRICQLLDYGVDIESFILVLKHYKCSLRHWRQQQNLQCEIREGDVSERSSQAFCKKLPLYLEVFSAVLQAASILKGGECTVRNRGTECVKSPEMLKLLCTIKQDDTFMYMQAKDESVGRAVDVWGLGCLLYELLTGEYLLYDEDWTRFFIRVTLPSEELITDEKAAKLNHYKPIIEFLHFVLVRDPSQRPTLDAVISQLERLQTRLKTDDTFSDPCIVQSVVNGTLVQNQEACDSVSVMRVTNKRSELRNKPTVENTSFNAGDKKCLYLKESDKKGFVMQGTTLSQDSKCQESSHILAPPSSPWWRSCIGKLICRG